MRTMFGAAAFATLLVTATVFVTVSCRPRADSAASATADIQLTWTLSQRIVGPVTVTVTLHEAPGAGSAKPSEMPGAKPSASPAAGPIGAAPIRDAAVRVEALMTHPGMAPIEVAATAVGSAPGEYRADFAFTMAGDWVLLVSATLPDGRRVERRIGVANVRPAA